MDYNTFVSTKAPGALLKTECIPMEQEVLILQGPYLKPATVIEARTYFDKKIKVHYNLGYPDTILGDSEWVSIDRVRAWVFASEQMAADLCFFSSFSKSRRKGTIPTRFAYSQDLSCNTEFASVMKAIVTGEWIEVCDDISGMFTGEWHVAKCIAVSEGMFTMLLLDKSKGFQLCIPFHSRWRFRLLSRLQALKSEYSRLPLGN